MGAMVRIQIVQAAILHPTIIHQATVSPIRSMSKWYGDQNEVHCADDIVCLVIIIIFLCTFPL